ncbi:MAG: hypothetical protein R2831_13325, partial [Chitinophagaceae bacterium]
MKNIASIILIAFLTSITTFVLGRKFMSTIVPVPVSKSDNSTNPSDVHFASYSDSPEGGYINLEDAAEKSSNAVVHIKTETKARMVQYRSPFGDDFFERFFGGG